MSLGNYKHLDELIGIALQKGLGSSGCRASIATNWTVFTGTYSAGKTTLIGDIGDAIDVRCQKEPSRTFLEKKRRSGVKLEAIWNDVAGTVLPIHNLRVDLECSIDPKERTLLDTAIPDTLPYALLYETNIDEIIKACSTFKYKEPIFLVEPLPFKKDNVRRSDPHERMALHHLREKVYLSLGYQVVKVPVLKRVDRLDFMIDQLSRK